MKRLFVGPESPPRIIRTIGNMTRLFLGRDSPRRRNMKTQTTKSFAVNKEQQDKSFGRTRLAVKKKKKKKKTMHFKNTQAHAITFPRKRFAVK